MLHILKFNTIIVCYKDCFYELNYCKFQTGGHLTEDLHKVTLFAFREQICHVSDARYDADIHICAGIEGGGKGQCTVRKKLKTK